MKLKKLSQAVLVASFFVAASASAATQTITSNSNVIVSKDTDWNDFLNFAKFNSSLGTLTSVKIELYSTVTGTVDLINFNDDALDVPFTLGATVALNRPDSSNLVLLNPTLFSTSVNLAGNGGTYSNSNSVQAYNSATFSGLSDLALFSGAGNISTLIAAQAWSSVSGDAVDAQFATQASGHGTVTYTYISAVPEPETYGMMLLGLGMLGLVAKRKRATQA